ncbi:hypothetical protein [Niveibacterium microcysteis]|uniref:Uncharacterized protein n=1 Tax=Niveibacterium microcysteis TaxID=2811415 RepID=A0ABX7M749_9RHOO|nr:hypothetical protein [Niveibacterium microcysteis]QSI77585.1 hypothetical protein JY500_02705 [Niveibacterium microcysteis]
MELLMNHLAANMRSSIVVLLSAVLALNACAPSETAEQKAQRERAKAGLALWEQKCKTEAGEKIYRRVEDVEGITLLRVRPPAGENEWHDRMWPGAAFAHEGTAEEYIKDFLGYEEAFGPDGKPSPITPTARGGINTSYKAGPHERPGYRFVDTVDSSNGERNRYVISYDEPWQQDKTWLKGYIRANLDKRPASGPEPRYGVTYEDHVVPEERALGVASSTVRVLDIQANEVLGELTVFAFTYGFESRGSSAWLRARICPTYGGGSGSPSRLFTDQVLVPRKDN